MLTVVSLTVGMSLFVSAQATGEMREDVLLEQRANQLLEVIRSRPFGMSTDSDPTTAALDEIFDFDADAGPITVHQLSRWPLSDDGWIFQLASSELPGTWRIKVDQDLDGDGSVNTTPPLSNGPPADSAEVIARLEYSGSVFSVRVFYDGQAVLATNVAEETE